MTSQIFKDLQPDQEISCLIGDVGGTNVRLQLVKISLKLTYQKAPQLKPFTSYNTDLYPQFQDYIVEYLKDVQKDNLPQIAIIGIAGPIKNNSTLMANTKWTQVDGNAIGQALNIKPFLLINDFQAVAYGILGLQETDLIQLNPKNPNPKENSVKTVIGPGTGLGVARLIPSLKQNNVWEYNIWPCEGGHVGYSPSNDLEIEYLQFLRKRLGLGQIVAEKAMAGQAVPYIYTFLKERLGLQSQIENDLDKVLFEDKNDFKQFPSTQVFQYGVEKKDELCQKVVDFFLSSYGTVIGDLVCNTMPYGGIYLFGNISIGVANYIINNPQVNFLQDYIKYRPHLTEIFDQIPIYVIKQASLGLEGAYQAAYRLLEYNDYEKEI
ncbi:unnamed protein product [Paramecium primaurelia]|uniref:Glucokinase n=1 Tax=Paramecium primaurelia TaxID=5886 RepID=A0A8S1N531_PARPR|nr:unnamed protein product [Paramecium primaurelia]